MTQSQREKKSRKQTTPAQSPTAKSSSPLGANPLLAQQAMADPAQVNPRDLLKIQRAYGNQMVGQLLTHQVEALSNKQAASPGVIQRAFIPKLDVFKNETNMGTLHKREDTLKTLDLLINEYHSSSEGSASPEKIKSTLQLLEEIQQMTAVWLDENQETTNIGVLTYMKAFGEAVKRDHNWYKLQLHKLEQNKVEIAASSRDPNSEVQKIQQRHEGSVESLFAKVAPVIDAAIPAPGSKCELEVEVKFPLQPPGFIGGRMKFEAERSFDKGVKLRGELAVTGGAKISVVEVAGELGGYLESQATTTKDALQLMSYGLYRRFREAKWLPREAASYMWGGNSSLKGYRRAEAWAGNIEKEVFGKQKDAYVESGAFIGAKAKAGVGIAEIEGSATAFMGRKYNADSIKQFKKSFLAKEKQLEDGDALGQMYVPKHRGGIQTFGLNTNQVKLKFKAKAGPLQGDVTATFKFQEELEPKKEPGDTTPKKKSLVKWAGFKLEATGQYPAGPEATIAAEIIKFMAHMGNEAQNQAQNVKNGAQNIGEGVESLGSIGHAARKLAGMEKFKIGWGAKRADGKTNSFEAENSGQLKIIIEKPAGGKPMKINLSINQVKESKLDLGVLKGGIKKTSQVLAFQYDGTDWISI